MSENAILILIFVAVFGAALGIFWVLSVARAILHAIRDSRRMR